MAAYYTQHSAAPSPRALPNLAAPQQRALRALRSDCGVVVKPADKNLGLVVLDRSWYVGECRRQLADAATYRVVPPAESAALLQRLRRQLITLLVVFGPQLPYQVWRYMRAALVTHTRLPDFYLLPKIHKLPRVTTAFLAQLRGRPIVASHSWVTTPVSQWLADVLNAACAAAFPHVLPDSRALIRQVESTPVSRDAFLVTFDVESMYPSIDVPLAVDACAAAVQ